MKGGGNQWDHTPSHYQSLRHLWSPHGVVDSLRQNYTLLSMIHPDKRYKCAWINMGTPILLIPSGCIVLLRPVNRVTERQEAIEMTTYTPAIRFT